jgi:ribosomal protein L7/L12
MPKLQELLDEKWPLRETDQQDSFWKKSALRDAFAQGYNAGVSSLREANDANPYDTSKVLVECRKMISEGKSLNALRLYKETMGCSLTDAKAILNL